MRHIAIVDDQSAARCQLREYLERYAKEHGEQFEYSLFENADVFLDGYSPVYDLVLLDIDMPGMNGMDAAHRLRDVDESVTLIFITNLAQYAIGGYEVGAVDFMVKPLQYPRFAGKLGRAFRLAGKTEKDVILIKTELGLVRIEQRQILYVEIQNHNLYYHTTGEVYRVRGSLKQAEERLNRQDFFVCNKCYIVNLAHVAAVDGLDVTVGNEVIGVSRPKRRAFMEALAAYHNKS